MILAEVEAYQAQRVSCLVHKERIISLKYCRQTMELRISVVLSTALELQRHEITRLQAAQTPKFELSIDYLKSDGCMLNIKKFLRVRILYIITLFSQKTTLQCSNRILGSLLEF